MEKMVSINPYRMQYAREYYDLSIDEVAYSLKMDKEKIVSFETGGDFPSYTQLNKFANLYNRNLLFFFVQEEPEEELTKVEFRTAASNSGHELTKKVKEMIEQANSYKLNLQELFQDEDNISFSDKLEKSNIHDGDELVRWLRSELDFSLEEQKKSRSANEIIEVLRERFYELGVYIFKDSFRENGVSGLCLYDETYPIILLNNKTSFTRQLFTIFHEVFHLFLKETDVYYESVIERKCDMFASEFLIPSDDFNGAITQYKTFEDEEVIKELASLYNVSREAIMYRLLALGRISNEFYSKLKVDFIRNSSGSKGGNFYYTRISYLGRTYLSNVFDKYYSGKIDIAKVGVLTQLKPAHVSKLASNMFGGVF